MLKKLNKNSETVLRERYYLKDDSGKVIETWPDLCNRVVNAVVPEERLIETYKYSEKEAKKIKENMFQMINELHFLPNSPCLFNAGTKNPMLSACFVIDVEDDLAHIYESVKESALIHKMGGGVGLSFSKLRSCGSSISTTHGGSSGSVSFMKAFSNATGVVTAGGRRHGANMGVQSIQHADIEEFLACKSTEGDLHNFNISVAITDDFIDAAKKGLDWDLIDPKDDSVVKTVKASDLMDTIVSGAWLNGEPGAVFIDRVNEDNPTPHLDEVRSSNPCGEFYSIPYNSCNLGSINLSILVENGKFNWGKFKKLVKSATLFLDCVIEACKYPLDKIDKTTKKTRPVGLGIMGFADALIKLGLKYNSKKARKFAENVAEIMGLSSLEESVELSKRAGSYTEFRVENHEYTKYLNFSARRKNLWKSLVKSISEHGLRNSHTTVIAPTGTLARIANEVSFGIEPVFAFEFSSNILDGKQLEYKHKLYKDHKEGNLNVDPSVFVSSKDVSPEDHVKMQAAFQKYTHNGISKTINLPNETTKEQVYDIYMLAHSLGLKGLTIYREGSRQVEVLVDKSRKKQRGRPSIDINKDVLQKLVEQEKMTVQKLSDIYDCSVSTIRGRLREYDIKAISKPERMRLPDEIDARRFKLETDLGSLYVMVGVDDSGQPVEVILNIGCSGATVNALAEGIGKLVSISLQCGLEVKDIVKTLDGIGGESVSFWKGKLVKSIPDFVAKVLRDNYMDKVTKSELPTPNKSLAQAKCHECGEELLFQEGCLVCSMCSYSKCGG